MANNAKNTAKPQSRPAPRAAALAKSSDKVDELFAPVARPITPATVWTWDAATKKLTPVTIQIGTTDGQFSALVSGDLKPGQQLLTSVVLPVAAATTSGQQNNIFNNMNGRGGPGGGFGPPGGGFGPGGGGFGGPPPGR
jgi:hypothetical protein